MKMTKFLSLATLTIAAFGLAGCSSATDNSTTPPAKSSTVYQITGTASGNLEAGVAVSLPTSGVPSGVTVSGASLVYAVDSTYAASSAGHPGWGNNGTWVANFTADPATASTWLTETCPATIGASSSVNIKFWMNSGHVYLKELDFTFSDNSTQKVTFASGTKPVHSVYSPVLGTAVTEDVALAWSYFDAGFSGLTTGVTTVAF